jgi:hypothetical protein
MYARTTTVQASGSAIDTGIAHIRDVTLPELMQIDGCIGLSMIVDRESRQCTVTTSWQSQEVMHASLKQIEPLRSRAVEILGGTPEFREWEIALMHRNHSTHDGACVRAGWLQTAPGNLDTLINTYRTFGLPQIEQLEGFCSASLLVDRETGMAVASACFESRAALNANRDQATQIRTQGTQQANTEVVKVGEFDLAVAHLRIPEMV